MIVVRPATEADCLNGLVDCLRVLSPVLVSPSYLASTMAYRRACGHETFVAVNEHIVVGTASVLIERKLNLDRAAAHVENVAVLPQWQGAGVGRLLVERCLQYARHLGCYKAILDCDETKVGFYEKAGFSRNGVCMRLDLPGAPECS